METNVEEEIRTMVREFRASVSADLSQTHRRMTELSEEVRQRISTSETAILNAMRDSAREHDRRITNLEIHAQEVDGRLDGIDGRLEGIDGRLEGIDGRLEGIDGRLEGIDGRLDVVEQMLQRILDAMGS